MTSEVSALSVVQLTKAFGDLVALDRASLSVSRGSFHALLGENGAGKSTLAKCVLGLYEPEEGRIEVEGHRRQITSPREAHQWGIGMVHQHFSLVPNMSVAENLIISKPSSRLVISWREELGALKTFCTRMPFQVDLSAPASSLAAGEKQKVEILKQLYLGHHILILDEPTTVLTIAEADELFAMLQHMCERGALSILLITHKLREVFKFAEIVTVLRRGRVVANDDVKAFSADDLANYMVGREELPKTISRKSLEAGDAQLCVKNLCVQSDQSVTAVSDFTLSVRSGEIVGIAGVSGNGQRELLEALAGQREIGAGEIKIHGETYRATRQQMRQHKVFYLPEEPLRSASVASMTLAENLAFRTFDQPPISSKGWNLSYSTMKEQAAHLVTRYGIKAASIEVPIQQLSGGNIQRSVLARELSSGVEVLIASNPCFGLDIDAVSEIHNEIMSVRNRGAAILLISEDLDELLALSDRIAVMFEGTLVYETPVEKADARVIGRFMTGHHAAA